MIILEKKGKSVQIVSPEFSLPAGHGFLPKSDAVQHELTNLQNFIIRVDVGKTKLESLSYDIQGDHLQIFLTPKNGFFEPADVKTSAGAYAFDLIITLDVVDLESLGALHKDHAEFFFRTPILNIDHHATNTRYGHVNLVDVTDSSVSETLFELIKDYDESLLDEHVATSLLAGIISKTKVFQSNTVTPRSLAIASHLMAAGGRRDEIIRHLYQTKSLPTLRAWGRALANLKASANGKIVWSIISAQDLITSQANAIDAAGVLDELMVNAPGADFYVLCIASDAGTIVHINHTPNNAPTSLPDAIVRQSPQYLSGTMPGQPETVANDIINRLS